MSQSSSMPVQNNPAPVQNNPAPVQNNPLPKTRPIDTLVNLLDKLYDNKDVIQMILNLYVGHINDIVDPNTNTNILMWAIDKKYTFCSDAIINTSIDKKHVDCNNDNALNYAIKHRCLGYAQKLIDKNFDMNQINNDGDTALALTIKAGFVQQAAIMINKGANIKLINQDIIADINRVLVKTANEKINPLETEKVKTTRKTVLIALLVLKTAFSKE